MEVTIPIPKLSLVPVHSNIETCTYMQPSPIYPRRGKLRRLATTDIYITNIKPLRDITEQWKYTSLDDLFDGADQSHKKIILHRQLIMHRHIVE